ncbi:nucleotidyltransferase family protein [Agromyces sp. MMS24-JH15]|uniref:nucleotidyltransferase family protein n=1 Tax=Agromyces sp. MMS24-JH15 TaxID=3243765 RepID=UPI003748E9D6
MVVALRVGEAVELGHPLVLRFADAVDARVLFIKGASLEHHGLRAPHASADVDVLVEPARFDALVASLQESGWHERAKAPHEDAFITHSTTLVRDGWPCDLDVHRAYPGFLADPATVFEALWERREPLVRAGHEVPIPDRASSALILALHSLRGSAKVPRHAHELDALVERLQGADTSELDDLVDLARATGAAATAAPFLERIGVDVRADVAAAAAAGDPEFTSWRRRIESGATVAHFYAELVDQTPWYRMPRLVFRALWPTEAEFRVIRPETPPGRRAALAGRWRRIARGLRDAPRVVRARRRVAREQRTAAL